MFSPSLERHIGGERELVENTFKPGGSLGLLVRYGFSDKLALQLEILHATRGTQVDTRQEGTYVGQFNFRYIELPLQIRRQLLSLGPASIYGGGGLSASILIGAERENGEDLPSEELSSYDVAGHLEIGAKMDVSESISPFIGLRYDHGFINSFSASTTSRNQAFLLSLGVTYRLTGPVPARFDRDSDGIADARDKCPEEPEDQNGFLDLDGCPDDDGDGIAYGRELCPTEAEDFDGFEDDDGCPDLDNDNDGVLDEDDLCPQVAFSFNNNMSEDDTEQLKLIYYNTREEFLGQLVGEGTAEYKKFLRRRKRIEDVWEQIEQVTKQAEAAQTKAAMATTAEEKAQYLKAAAEAARKADALRRTNMRTRKVLGCPPKFARVRIEDNRLVPDPPVMSYFNMSGVESEGIENDIDRLSERIKTLTRQMVREEDEAKKEKLDKRIRRLKRAIPIAGDKQWSLAQENQKTLNQINLLMRLYYPSMRIRIEGRTDSKSSNEDEDAQLGQRRADSVRKYLVENPFFGEAIEEDRLSTESIHDHPDEFETSKDEDKNRRVDFVIVAKD